MTSPSEKTFGLEHGPPHRLLRGDVADRARTRGLDGVLRDLGETEVGQAQLVVRKQDEVVGLDVAVNDAEPVGVGHGGQRLLGQGQGRLRRKAATHPLRERAFAERHGDHEMPLDERGVADRHDIRVLELRREPRLALEVHEVIVVHAVLMRHLERDAEILNRVPGLVDGRNGTVRDPPLDPVLAEFLSRLEQWSRADRRRRRRSRADVDGRSPERLYWRSSGRRFPPLPAPAH